MRAIAALLLVAIILTVLPGCGSTQSVVPRQMRVLIGHEGVFQQDAILVRCADGEVWAVSDDQGRIPSVSQTVVVRLARGTAFRVLAARVRPDQNDQFPYLACRSKDGQYRFYIDSRADDDFVMIVDLE